ncbi:MAG: YkgJ family cysteine cluster protein [Pyrobaculum sp.]
MFNCPVGCPSDCCRFENIEEMPIVLEEEVEILRREAAERGFDLYFEYVGTHRGVKLFRWIIRGWCPFYKNKCTIHEKKPLSCKIYPLVLNLKTGDIYLSERCLWVKLNGPRRIDYFPIEKENLKKLLVKLKIK